ncbi:hypothetical protein [Uliginosibacterium gangwonense]|uniref:hypothetical protein n=1 Tax=Uliginosibacterium gangwonense TaxID=392736 RepID=UPI00036303D0|nr:hypothetical protein [Uliginosibacterium gangwonense]
MNSKHLVLQAGNLSMAIDPMVGARIVSFALESSELLTPASVHANYGSTFWDSPQTNWNWPPRAALDAKPYAVAQGKGWVELTSEVDACGLQFVKRIQANAQLGRFEIDYRMINHSTQPLKAGPWEVTRVEGGLSFFPYESVPGLPPTALEPVVYQDGICWYPFDAAYLEVGHKLFSGAREGWLAHAGPARTLFIKTFPDTQPQDYAPEQAEVEIWGHDKGAYIELENHGVYQTIMPGQQTSYKVNWYLRRLADGVNATVGNAELVKLVRQIIAA